MLTDRERALADSIDAGELVELTRELVRIDSVIRPETGASEARAAEFIAGWIRRELEIEPLIEEVEPGRLNVVATLESGRPGPLLLLEGHTDVVSEGDRRSWSHDPFAAEISEGRIYGRGACDMKGGLAVALLTAKALAGASAGNAGRPLTADTAAAGPPFCGRIRLGLVCDEEGMMIGIKDFIRRGHAEEVDAALIPEPEENHLCLSMKGAIRALVRVHGKMAHGCLPLSGINPNTRLARTILAFEEYETEEKKRCGEDPYLGWPSITFTVLQAPPPGEPAQLNVIPAQAVGFVDIRTTPAQDHDKLRERLRGILLRLSRLDPDYRAEIEFIEDRPVVTMGKEEPIVRAAASAFRDVTGRRPVYNGVPGATDGTFLRAWKGIPCLVNGPGPRHIPHQKDEYIEIEELIEAARIYVVAARRFLCGGCGPGDE
jgi:succinyl-diaminopimelate desuccinylase